MKAPLERCGSLRLGGSVSLGYSVRVVWFSVSSVQHKSCRIHIQFLVSSVFENPAEAFDFS